MSVLMRIGRPVVTENEGKTRMSSVISFGEERKLLWVEVDRENGRYLSPERSDGLLVGLLWYAMYHGYDIECEAPVTGELLYKLETYLVPTLSKYSTRMRKPLIKASIAEEQLNGEGAVGTGISCGVDSFHAVCSHYRHHVRSLRLTHLTLYNVGAFGCFDLSKADAQFEWQINNSRQLAAELGLKLVVLNSNLKALFPTDNRFTHTFSNAFSVYCLQKLWSGGAYFYASSGVDFASFDVHDADCNDSSHYDLLSLFCFSTHSLSFYSEGGAKTRFDKVRTIVGFEPTERYLQVCCKDDGKNCGICFKCKRTLVILDALDVVDRYVKVFDVDRYKRHRNDYLCWMLAQYYGCTAEKEMVEEAVGLMRMRHRIPFACQVKGWLVGAIWYPIKERLKHFHFAYSFFLKHKWVRSIMKPRWMIDQ